MRTHNFILSNCDTDSVMFCKQDHSLFTEEEQQTLVNEINSLLPEFIKFENDGFFPRVIIVKAKNYALFNGTKISYKGSAFKSATKEPVLRELMNTLVECLIHNTDTPQNIYDRYIDEAMNIVDINRWAIKKSITKKLIAGTRKNETKVLDAIDIDSFREGDKVYLYCNIEGKIQDTAKGELVFYKDGSPKMIENRVLKLVDDFDGSYDIVHYVKRVYDTMSIFKNVIDMESIIKYHSSKSLHLLEKFRRTLD